MSPRLHLHEEILLLGLHDTKGNLTASTTAYAMAGAMLAELLLEGRVALAPGKRPLVDVRSRERLGDPLLDEALGRIASAKRRAVLTAWVARLAGAKRLVRRACERLCAQGILVEQEGKVLWVFPTKRYPERDHGPEEEIVRRIERALSGDELDVDERTVALVALAYHSDLVRAVFRRDWLKLQKGRVKRLIERSEVGEATRAAIAAVQAAMMAAVIAASTAAAVT